MEYIFLIHFKFFFSAHTEYKSPSNELRPLSPSEQYTRPSSLNNGLSASTTLDETDQQLFAFPPQRRPGEPGKSNPPTAAFFQNSKLNQFFSSPFYLQNIHEYSGEVAQSPPSPLTREATWYKDYLNGNV